MPTKPQPRPTWRYVKLAEEDDSADASYEQAMSQLADIVLSARAKDLKPFEVGFQLIDRDDDEERAVGVKAFKVGDEWIFVPIFFINGKIKGAELLFIKSTKTFVPLQDDWVAYLLNKQTPPIGESVPRELGRLGVSSPDLTQLLRPPAKFAAERLPALRAEADAIFRKEVLPAWAKVLVDPGMPKFAVDLPGFLKEAGRPALLAFADMARECPGILAAAYEFHGDDLTKALKVAATVVPPAPRRYAKTSNFSGDILDAFHPIKSGKLAVQTTDKALDGESGGDLLDGLAELDEKGSGVPTGPLIEDSRGEDQVTRRVRTDHPRAFINPDATGLYEVLVRPNSYEKCLVILAAKTTNGRMRPAIVVRLSDKQFATVMPNKVFCGRKYDGPEWSEFFGSLPDATSLPDRDGGDLDGPAPYGAETSEADRTRDVFIGPDGEASAPMSALSSLGDADGGTSYRVMFDACCYDCNRPEFPGASGSRPEPYIPLTYDEAFVNVGTSRGRKIQSAESNMYIPAGFKKLTIKRPARGEYVVQPGSPMQLTLDLIRKTDGVKAAWSRDGTYAIGGRSYRERDAVLHLVMRRGFSETDAGLLLKSAKEAPGRSVEWRVVYPAWVKEADSMLSAHQPGAPGIPEPWYGVESTLSRDLPSLPAQWQTQTVPDLEPRQDAQRGYDLRSPDQNVLNAVTDAAQTGRKEVFDTSAVGSLLQTTQGDLQVDRWLGPLMQGLNAKGQVLLQLYWHPDDFRERYGEDDISHLEDMLRNTFINDGKLILNLKQQGVEDPLDSRRELDLETASEQ